MLEKKQKQIVHCLTLGAILGSLLWMPSAQGARNSNDSTQVQLNAALGTPVMKADEKQTAFLKVGLTGFELKDSGERSPVNVCLVIDRSGSMSGDKIVKAREAAIMAVDRLDSKDILSIVAYDHTVNVLLPATKVTDKHEIRAAIRKLVPGGNTALFAGVSKGAKEIRKFLDENRVNRIVLVSDGLANVGPSSPSELGELGASLRKEGISVSTIGLGLDFNEDLMVKLAIEADGNHAFAENSTDLARIFDRELGDILSIVAQDVFVRIECREGIRPVRMLGREATIDGQLVTANLTQLYSNQEKYLMLEVEVPATSEGGTRDIAKVTVTYDNMATTVRDELSSQVAARFSGSDVVVKKERNKDVVISAVRRLGALSHQKAVTLRDEGKVEEAQEVLHSNATLLGDYAAELDAPVLYEDQRMNNSDAKNLENKRDWARQRKQMQDDDFQISR